MLKTNDQANYERLLSEIRMNEPTSDQELRDAVESAIKDRSKFFYCVYKTLLELHPDIDATEVMREASRKFGSCRSGSFHNTDDCREVVKNDYPKEAMLVYEVEIEELNEDKAVCNFKHCPHMEAFREMGCTADEMERFCLDMLIYGDYAAYADCKNIELSFPRILARGEDVCEYTLTKQRDR
ncbi:L-2-amino-thiazoline-4-carboxylic acid hydrolase [Bacilliculturomica massiliensis]|uniref:L-2-amino-thiazoline-4-carboxylic acid hydrolase n=1 Tax=Bacilliculturomica massiliensis TaxID=1917867 RepID=UPI0010320CFE|nr:L-2-amino-thiazoline-4-carboxylic acid hydrolase [Bacilliculturomica massiliensis]